MDHIDVRLMNKVRSAPQQVSIMIKEAILDGTLLPGSRLPSEEALAASFGVSRPTIRQALQSLRAAGVINAVRGRGGGHIVGEFPAGLAVGMGQYMTLAVGSRRIDYRDIFEVRAQLELLSASTAAARRTDEDLRALGELDALWPDGDEASWTVDSALRYDLAFHRRLAECSHNPLIEAFTSATIITFQDSGVAGNEFAAADVLRHLDDVHRAVIVGSSDDAREAMRRHLCLSGNLCGFTSVEAAGAET